MRALHAAFRDERDERDARDGWLRAMTARDRRANTNSPNRSRLPGIVRRRGEACEHVRPAPASSTHADDNLTNR